MSDIGPVVPPPPLPVTPATQPAPTTPGTGTVTPPAAPPPDAGQSAGQQTGNPQTGNPQSGNTQAGAVPADGTQTATPPSGPAQSAPAPAGTTQAGTTQAGTTQAGTTQTGAPQQAAGQQSDAAAQISDSLRQLARGGELAAQVVARDSGALLVRTAAGTTLALTGLADVLAQANTAVLAATLKLQLNPENPQQATVTAVNGTALQPAAAALAQPPTAAQLALAVSPPQPGAGAAPLLPVQGQVLAAVVVPQPVLAPQSGVNPAAAAALPPGSQLQLVVQSATLPVAVPVVQTTPQGQTPAQTQTAPAGAPPQTPPQQSAAHAAAQAAIAAGRPSPATPAGLVPVATSPSAAAATPPSVAAAPPGFAAVEAAPSAAAATLATPFLPASSVAGGNAAGGAVTLLPQFVAQGGVPTVLSGIVTGQNQAGQTLVNTPQGLLALTLAQTLPPGSQLNLELAALVRPPPPPATALGPAPLGSVLSRLQGEWPVLQQTLDAIRAADPALAQRLQDQLLPQANVRLAATALQFMAAAAAGSAQAWLGSEAVRKLQQQGKGDLLRKLDDDFRELGRLNQRQGDNQWQALVMPMLIGGRVEAIQIFMRRRRDPKRKQSQTRFIIDFNLESTGPIQFDGFVSPKQLDLVLRSESDFGPAFRLDVSAIFEEALAITGMTGSIRFHGREKPLDWPSPELEARGPSTELKA